jgi:hypothetical protein
VNVRRRGDAGQAVPLVGGMMAVAVALLIAVGQLGRTAADGARARTAADAAALAGAAEGRDAAALLAAENGGTLVSYTADQGAVLVTVSVGRASATARAALVADERSLSAATTVTRLARS